MEFQADSIEYWSQNGIETVFFGNEEKELALVMSSVPGTADHYFEWNDQSNACNNAVKTIELSGQHLHLELLPEAAQQLGMDKVSDRRLVTVEDVYRAVEILILRRDTHLDHLGDKLSEPRVARVIERILAGDDAFGSPDETYDDDVQYLKDLGLVRKTPEGLAIANPIYREVVPRQLTLVQQEMWAALPEWYIGADGRLNIEAVLKRFFAFYRENAEMITLPRLKPAAFTIGQTLPAAAELNSDAIARLNFLYAKDWTAGRDWEVLIGVFR
jgi:hypothetical protein